LAELIRLPALIGRRHVKDISSAIGQAISLKPGDGVNERKATEAATKSSENGTEEGRKPSEQQTVDGKKRSEMRVGRLGNPLNSLL
jgi:hypothetical protein